MNGLKDGLWSVFWLGIVLGGVYGVVLAKHWHGCRAVVVRNRFSIERRGYIRCEVVEKKIQ